MASSNVGFYQRQKELQASLHEKEQERIRLEQQLFFLLKTDKRLSKLKAAKLQSYWKRICSDEKKSRQRNEKILQDFDRIEGHLSSVTLRTEKLKMLKKQYESQLKDKYPNWKSLIDLDGAEKDQKEEFERLHVQHEQQPHQQHPQPQHKGSLGKHHHAEFHSNIKAVRDLPYTHKTDHNKMKMGRTAELDMAASGSGDKGEITLEELSSSGMGSKREFSHEDISSQTIEEDEDEYKEEEKEEPGGSKYSYSRPAPHLLPLHQQRHHEPQIIDHKPSMETVAEEEDEEVSDYADINVPDETLPIRQFNTDQLRGLENLSLDAAAPLVNPSQPEQPEPATPRSLLRSDSSSIKSNSPLPDLTLEGLLFLLKFLQEEIPMAPNVDSYYRCQHPPLAVRKEIIRQANSGEKLEDCEGNALSMVILEQLTLVVREFTGGCLLSDRTLLNTGSCTNQTQLRSQLHKESQGLWDKLFEHFCTLQKHKVMGPQEIAAVFVPGLVADKSENQDKAFSLIVRLLENIPEEDTPDDLSSVTFSSRGNILLPASPKKTGPSEDVPPLSFGSMIDKQTDEESDFFDQSLPKDSLPLNETEAYRNMLSGTFSRGGATEPQREEDDTDDDVEKQFASVLSPRTPRSKAGSRPNRSPRPAALASAPPPDPVLDDVMSEISSTSPPMSPVYTPTVDQTSGTNASFKPLGGMSRNSALKIGSDLDSDTDLEFPMSGGKSKSKASLDDDFDFYG
ncbi:LOW QUALITY PROTEIN: centrosomal protein kizuna-like [Liolophura sinensis]|uniref:LOW QUALITY PROTEIN: centrosomal protein kizuna-like n=1 Tax=Liolophura sinensis TaxID=3198878 RepID=UPI00315854EE